MSAALGRPAPAARRGHGGGPPHPLRPHAYASVLHSRRTDPEHIGNKSQRSWGICAAFAEEAAVDFEEEAAVAPVDAGEWVEIGIVGPPHGVIGEFKVQPLTDFPQERLEEPGARWLQAPVPKIGRQTPSPPEEVALEWGRRSIFKVRCLDEHLIVYFIEYTALPF